MNALDDSAITDRCTLYEDSANFLKDERFMKNIRPYKPLKDERRGHKNHHMSQRVKVRQNLSKRLKARQMCVDDERKCNLKKNSLINCTGHPIMHRTPKTYQGLRSRTSNAIRRLCISILFVSCSQITFKLDIFSIERIHSRGQHPSKFMGTREIFYIRRVQLSQDLLGTPIWLP